MSEGPKRSYITGIDLTSRAQAERAEARTTKSFTEPEPSLPPATVEALPDSLREAVQSIGWSKLMPVQEKAVPYLLDGRDMIVQSRTGSGKTGGFLLPLFNLLDEDLKAAQALVLSPTRELARQIHEEFDKLRGNHPFTSVLIYGGVKYEPQIKALKNGAQVIIGTPGRILDHIQQGRLVLDDLKMLVFDEADEMLSMGFYPDMLKLERYLPLSRQSCMFSATMPKRVRYLSKKFLNDPGFLSLSSGNVSVDAIEHRYYRVDRMAKDRILVRLIEMENPDSAIIFANTKRDVEYLGQFLQNYGYDADSISGDLSQRAREKVMKKIRDGRLRFLVATDVAARGIDITDLSHVIQYDLPQDPEYYVHRAGRTARAGKTGTAITLITIEEQRNLLALGQRYAIPMSQHDVPDEKDVEQRVTERLTVVLESNFRDKSNMEKERLQRFKPLVDALSAEEPELLAMLLDDLYHETLHKVTEVEHDGAPSEDDHHHNDDGGGSHGQNRSGEHKGRGRGRNHNRRR
ncbi:MAG: DEAD/DEAH box helicase [Rhodothermales bacterium]